MQLIKRIEYYKKAIETSKKNEDEPICGCDAILVTQSMVGEDEKMKEFAKEALQGELDGVELEVERIRGEIYVGNHAGIGLAGMKTMCYGSLYLCRATGNDTILQLVIITLSSVELRS